MNFGYSRHFWSGPIYQDCACRPVFPILQLKITFQRFQMLPSDQIFHFCDLFQLLWYHFVQGSLVTLNLGKMLSCGHPVVMEWHVLAFCVAIFEPIWWPVTLIIWAAKLDPTVVSFLREGVTKLLPIDINEWHIGIFLEYN